MTDDDGAAEGSRGSGGPGMGGRSGFCGARGGKAEDKEWIPTTKLRCLIYLFSLPIKESELIDFLLGASLKDEVLKIMPVQKQTHAGQRDRFKAFVAIGDYNGHVGLDLTPPNLTNIPKPHQCNNHWVLYKTDESLNSSS
uniref:S5 DRBM domain-containing protein n=1 Tax=Ursus maritimus TaxID=29073 RepID=A0A452ULR8_URSMA